MVTNEATVDSLNALLRGELAAMETYQQALEKMQDAGTTGALVQIHRDHQEAASTLCEHIYRFGGRPEQESGAWGVFAQAVEGAAGVMGAATALKGLKEGEEYGAKSYEDSLEDMELPAECKMLIRASLLPQTRQHVIQLDRMLSGRP